MGSGGNTVRLSPKNEKETSDCIEYLLNSFPVPICDKIRILTVFSTLGIFPLAIATGAGAGSRQLGTAVFGEMLIATFLSLFLVPILYVVASAPLRFPKFALSVPAL